MNERSSHLDEATELLLDLAAAMHASQVPSDVIEHHLEQIVRRLGMSAEFILFQSYMAAEVRERERRLVRLRRIDFDAHWRLARVQALGALGWSLAEGRLGIAEARAELEQIMSARSPYSRAIVVLAYAVYGAAVAARIGGRWLEMLVAGLIGLIAGVVHFGTLRFRQVDLQKSFLAGLLGSLAGLSCTLLLPPFNFARALFGGVTLLVPAMMIVIATHELASDALESGAARLAYGLLRFVMLAAGITAAVKLWTLVLPLSSFESVTPLPYPVILGILAIGGVSLIACVQGRPKDIGWMVTAVMLAYGTQELTKTFAGKDGSPFLTAFVLGVAAHLQGRLPGHSDATMLVPGLLQLAPGFLGTQSVLALLQDQVGGHATFFHVILVAVQLVGGLLLAAVLFRRPPSRGGQRPRMDHGSERRASSPGDTPQEHMGEGARDLP